MRMDEITAALGAAYAAVKASAHRAKPYLAAFALGLTMLVGLSTGTVSAADAEEAVGSIWDYFPMIISLMMLSIIVGVLGGLFSAFKFGKK